ncbi:MAG: acyl-CoA carboxylase subunit epsilon [Micromonosporaceae bacterium]|nr:acyl-CoA carboxylase subunit epsilon [Micromonosporaceae bacterium]
MIVDGLRVVRGTPTPEELAALVVALAVVAPPGGVAVPPVPRSRWRASAHPGSRGGADLRPGPGAWRASAQPR